MKTNRFFLTGFASTVVSLAMLSANADTCAPAPSGLVGWWRGESNANDTIATNNGALSASGAGYAASEVGSGFRFDGTNGYVQIPDSDALKPTNVTCEAWVWLDPGLPANRGGEQIVFKKNTWSAWFEGYSLLKVTIDNGDGTYSNRFQFCVSHSGNQVAINSLTIPQRGEWYHVAATYDGVQSRLYVNGSLEASASPGFALDYDTTPIFIGTSGTWPPYLSMFGGIIDEVSIYNRALSASEILAIYTTGGEGKCVPSAVPANLIANGSFENPADIDSYQVFDTSNPIPDWIIENGTVEIVGPYWEASEGVQSLDLNGIFEEIGTIYQDVPTVPGQKYRVRFAYAGNPDGEVPAIKSANVFWDGQLLAALTFDITGHSRTNMGWTYAEYLVTATNTTTRLRFQSTSPTFCGLTLDDVSVMPFAASELPCHDYANFNSPAGLNLTGSASVTNGVLRLTPAVDSQTGDVWLSAKQPAAAGFDTTFHFRITELGNIYGNEPGGDGFTFSIQNLSPTNQSWAMGDTNQFVAVFFNTFWNWPGCTCPDVSDNSVGILVNQTYIAQTDLNPFGVNMSDGAVHEGHVRFDGSVFNVWVDGFMVLTNVPLAGLAPGVDGMGEGWVGFTAGTGAAYENHDLLDWSFCVPTANVPVITSFSPAKGQTGETIYIPGEYFSPIESENIVYFGAVRANVVSASATRLYVSVPSGATFAPITVSVAGRVAYSPKPFQPEFAGNGSSISAASFAQGFNLTSGDGPARVVIADLDGDGKPDLAVANGNAHTISLYRNISIAGTLDASSFAPRVDLPGIATADSPYKVEVADVDGDGKLDLLAVNRSANTISIFRNVATPGTLDASSFAPRVDFTVGALPLAVAVRDLDGDGRPEIITANYTDASVTILKNIGIPGVINSNSFAAPVNFPAGAGAANLVCGDLDGDGKPDLAVVNFNQTFLSVLRNVTGIGVINSNSFAPQVNFASPDSCEAISIGDLDGDGKLDLISGASLRGQMMSVYRNIATPGSLDTNSFEPRVDFASGNWVHTTALSDLNGDGKLDIALTGESASQMSVFQNLSAPGSFTNSSLAARVDFPAGWNGWGLSAGDLDGDGRPDVVFCNFYDDTLTIYRNTSPFFGAPQFSGFADQTIHYNTSTDPIAFTVSDPFYPAASLVVTASTWWPDLIDTNGIVISGTDSNRTVTLTPNLNRVGSTVIVMTVTSPGGATSQTSFVLNVINSSPVISSIAAKKILINASTPALPFMVSDYETPADQLLVTATSSNTNFVPNPGIVLGGSGTNRTVTVTPGSNQVGTTTIRLAVIDDLGASNQTTFTVTVNQFTNVVTGLPIIRYGAATWGDYDNDGKLDLLISGSTNGLGTGAITRIYHNDGGTFTNFISLTNVWYSSVAWSDYDRDGRLDALVSGINSSNVPVTRLYHNNGNGTFTDINANLIGVYSGTVAWGDFNNDGAPDLFISGIADTNTTLYSKFGTNACRLYRNDGNGVFTDVSANLPAISLGSAAWGDYDNDGRLDLLLVGTSNSVSGVTALYRNLGNGAFSNAFNFISGVSYYGGAAAWGDFDNDGWLDVAITANIGSTYIYRNNRNGTFSVQTTFSGAGTTASGIAWGDFDNDGYLDLIVGGSTSRLYRNNGNGTFTDTQTLLPSMNYGPLAWGDYDNDGDLDLLYISAQQALLIRNNSNISNTPPAAPFDLTATVGLTNSVTLKWNRPVDSQTKSNGLNYNIRVGTVVHGIDIVSPLANPTNGARRIAAIGNAGTTNRALLLNLPKGTYHWSVQAIDGAYAGSPFFALQSLQDYTFTITNSLPVISSIPDITIAPGTNNPGPVLPFTIGDAETSASRLILSVRSSNTNVVPTNNIVIVRGGQSKDNLYPSNCTVRVAARTNGTSVITITVTDAQGAFASENFTVTAEQFSIASNNFIQVQNGSVAWGDYNNDGRLDVLISGTTNPITQLYRNDGNGVFTPVATPFPGVFQSGAAWGDYDNDGYLDLLLTGLTNGSSGGGITRIYHSNGDGTFMDIGANLPNVGFSSVAWGDYDNDGKLDFVLTGSTSNGAITRLYHNNSDGTFSNAISLTGSYQGAVAWADLDGDGDLDLVVSGTPATGSPTVAYRNNGNGTFTQAATLSGGYGSIAVGDFDNDGRPDILLGGYRTFGPTVLYRNTGNFTFMNVGVNLPNAQYAAIAWGDYDNDGRLDILFSGYGGPPYNSGFTRIYRNTGSPINSQLFTNVITLLPTNYMGTVSWVDFDNSGKLGILLTGTDGTRVLAGNSYYLRPQTLLFRNNNWVTNTPPTAPTALSMVHSNNLTMVSWTKSTDAQTTNSNGLKYQIRVGTSPGGIDFGSPESDLSNGYRRVVYAGDASSNRWQLLNLPPGTYYWNVQAIDTAFAGSPFAPESSFFVPHPPIAVGDAFTMASNTTVTFAAAKLTLNDIDADGFPLTVIDVASHNSLGGQVVLASDQVTYTAPVDFVGNDLFAYTISNGHGDTAIGSVMVTIGSGGTVAMNIVNGPMVIGGNFAISFAGIPGLTYTIETASSLSGPWIKVTNLAAPTTDQGQGVGIFSFSEPVNGNSARFYRTIYPAY